MAAAKRTVNIKGPCENRKLKPDRPEERSTPITIPEPDNLTMRQSFQ